MDEVVHRQWKRKFYIEKDGLKARLKYKIRRNQVLEILKTEVPEEWRGKGVGKRLTEAVLQLAKSINYSVKPTCSFARSLLDKLKPEDIKIL